MGLDAEAFEPILDIKNRKSKGPKLLFNTSIHSLPIKVVQEAGAAFKTACLQTKNKVTAAIGRPHFDGDRGHCNSKVHAKTFWRVLLDSGSDGDILFQQKGKKGIKVPYVKRLTPMVWLTSMGTFSTEKLGQFELAFPEYSESKRISLSPDIVEYASEDYEPKFDLIIGTETMKKLGIVLDFKRQMIEIDQIDLPMRKLVEIQQPKRVFHSFQNPEPTTTSDLTKRTVRILDAKYEKADLSAIVEKCEHLTQPEKNTAIAAPTEVRVPI